VSCVRLTVVAMLALVSFSTGVASDENRGVQLRFAVEVQHSVVWLSDILPPDAPAGLRKAGAAIAICRAPQPGSVRILEASLIERRLAQQPEVLRRLRVPSRVRVQSVGWPIREESVRGAISKYLRDQGWKNDLPEEAKLQWLEGFASSVEHPALEVAGAEWDEDRQSVEARLRCSHRLSCGSFLVHVMLPRELSRQWREKLGSGAVFGADQPPFAGVATGPVLAEKGKPATLIFDAGNMQISLPVICLQEGVLNQHIRVFNAQSRRVFRAEVVGAGLLRASL
jgi:hypothetical protein